MKLVRRRPLDHLVIVLLVSSLPGLSTYPKSPCDLHGSKNNRLTVHHPKQPLHGIFVVVSKAAEWRGDAVAKQSLRLR